MRVKQGLFAYIFLFNLSYSLLIPPDALNQSQIKNSKDDQYTPVSKAFIELAVSEPSPEVKKLIQIFEKIEKETQQDLSSFFLSNEQTLALLSLQFWAFLLKLLFATHSGSVLSFMDDLELEDIFLGAYSGRLESLFPFSSIEKIEALMKQGTNTQAPIVSWPKERGGVTLSLQSHSEPKLNVDSSYGPEMSYESLQKWIEDYGLSASSLRDYLETYLFAGDHSWTAEIAAILSENKSEGTPDSALRNRLAVLGQNIKLALDSIPFETQVITETEEGMGVEYVHDDNQHVKAASHVPFKFEGFHSDDEENYEKKSSGDNKLKKRSLEDPSDFNPLVYSFSRLDAEEELQAQDMSFDNSKDGESKLMPSKHRIFENDEIMTQEASPRSKDYRQVVYDASPVEARLAKREVDCVPVTWYNVFHHSIFGKHKFCHV